MSLRHNDSIAVQFVGLRVPQLPPWVLFTRNGVAIVLAPLWVLALPFIGALGAWLSLRACAPGAPTASSDPTLSS